MSPTQAVPRGKRILVVGVGRGTGGIVEILHDQRSDIVDTMYITTDRTSLGRHSSLYKVLIGNRLFGGKGANGFPELGERAAEDAKRDIEPLLAGYQLIVMVGTLGKGTGSGALPVISSLAESTGAFVINLCTIPSAVLESMPRTVANHTRHNMLKRGFNMICVDQDRFLEVYGNRSVNMVLKALDALMAGVISSMAESLYGHPERGITVQDLRTLFKEGNEGSLLVGDYDLADPISSASSFLSCMMMKGDVRSSKGLLLQMMVPENAPNGSMRSILDAIFDRLGDGSRTVFISSIKTDPDRDRVDMFGIATGMADVRMTLDKALKEGQVHKLERERGPSSRWDVPMVA